MTNYAILLSLIKYLKSSLIMIQLVICKAYYMAGQRDWNGHKALKSLFLSERRSSMHRCIKRQPSMQTVARDKAGEGVG